MAPRLGPLMALFIRQCVLWMAMTVLWSTSVSLSFPSPSLAFLSGCSGCVTGIALCGEKVQTPQRAPQRVMDSSGTPHKKCTCVKMQAVMCTFNNLLLLIISIVRCEHFANELISHDHFGSIFISYFILKETFSFYPFKTTSISKPIPLEFWQFLNRT